MKLKTWLGTLTLIAGQSASAAFVNLGYSLADGVNMVFNVGGGLVVGGSYHSGSIGYKDGTGAEVKMNMAMPMAKVGWYSSGLGESSWYVTGSVGKMTLKGKGTAGPLSTEGSSSANSAALMAGRHFFLSFLDVKVGVGAISLNGWQDAEMRDENGTLATTVAAKEFPTVLPAIDVGVGFNF